MEAVRTVTLELLRHGPPTISSFPPLTQYLALCGNHPAMSIQVPFEHKQLLIRLQELQYRGNRPAVREFHVTDMGHVMGEVLAKVPGLIAELADCDVRR